MAAKLIEGVGTANVRVELSLPSQSLAEIARQAIFPAQNPGQVVPASYQLPNQAAFQPLLQVTADLIALNEEIVAALQGAATPEELKAILRLQMVATERALKNPNDPQLDNLADWVRNQLAQGNGLGTDFTALGEDDIDLSTLIAPSFNFDPNSNSISASAKIPAGAATAFASLVNTAFSVSLDKRGRAGRRGVLRQRCGQCALGRYQGLRALPR